MIVTTRYLMCDGCGETYDADGGAPATYLRSEAKIDGWSRKARKDLCESCSSPED